MHDLPERLLEDVANPVIPKKCAGAKSRQSRRRDKARNGRWRLLGFLASCLSVFFLAGLLYGERFCAAKVVRLCVIRLACNLNAEVGLLQRNAIDQDGDDWQDSLAGELFVFEFANYARSLNRELAQTGRCRRIWSTSTRFSEQTSGMKA